MKKIVFVILIFLFCSFSVFAIDVQVFDSTELAVKVVNEYRTNPVQYLKDVGFDVEEIKSVFTEDEFNTMNNGLYDVSGDLRLTNACSAHMQDMFNNVFISHVGSDNSTPDSRALMFGYDGFIGEVLFFIAFENFVSVEDAFNILIGESIKSVISKGFGDGRVFSSIMYRDLGSTVGIGEIMIEDKLYHVYGVCFMFGIEVD